MTNEDDYKKWLEEMLIESNPDWVCDGMYDLEFTHEWCGEHCGEDSNYVTPKCLHLYYHHIARADRKTENSSEIPNNCEDLQDWKDRMWAEAIVTEPTCSKMEHVDKDINVRSKDCETCKWGEDKHRYAHICNECGVGINNYEPKHEPQTCFNCKHNVTKHTFDHACGGCTNMNRWEKDEPQTELVRVKYHCINCAENGSYKCSKCDGEMYYKYDKDEPQTERSEP